MAVRKSADLPRDSGVGSPSAAARSPVGGTGSTGTLVRQSAPDVGPETRHEMIARLAYMRAQARGFAPGHELEDWLSAEDDVDHALAMLEPALTPQRHCESSR
jgi:hypothetical protein